MRRLLLLPFVLSLACAGASPPPAPPSGPASAAPAAPVYPPPFTSDQLRAASRVGRTYVFRVEAAGKPTILRQLQFTKVEADRAEITATVKDETGKVIETRPPASAAWDELRHHGEFARDRVTTTEEEVKVPAGTYKVTVYTVRGEAGEVERFYFAKELPGPPVLFATDKDGKRVTTSTLVEYRGGE